MIYISEHADYRLKEYLSSIDTVSLIEETETVYKEVSSHPDIYMCSLKGEVIHYEKEELGFSYPKNCAFNAACTGNFFIHNLKCTAPRLMKKASMKNMTFIDVPQGYSKCNILIVDENSIITSDKGIFNKTKDVLDVLLIKESSKDNPYIRLKGFPYGFIGGTSGRIGHDIIFNGSLKSHPDSSKIKDFIESRGLNIIDFDYPLEDIGSIIYE